MTILRAGSHEIDLSAPCVMGILNVTADSFYDGGRLDHGRGARACAPDARRRRAHRRRRRRIDASGRGAGRRSRRTAARHPVVEALAREGACVSVDTMKPARDARSPRRGRVDDQRRARVAGARRAGRSPPRAHAAVCLMHMQGEPGTMQTAPAYADVVAEIRAFLHRRASACVDAGIVGDRIVTAPSGVYR